MICFNNISQIFKQPTKDIKNNYCVTYMVDKEGMHWSSNRRIYYKFFTNYNQQTKCREIKESVTVLYS